MRILAIETSCDDTGIAILEIKGLKNPDFRVLSNIVSSQVEIHKKYGGVFPMMAKREHQNNLTPVLMQALKEVKILKTQKNKSQKIDDRRLLQIKEILKKEDNLYKYLTKFLEKYKKPEIDLIAVTNGPGLEPCLWVGINFAKALSYFWDIPIVSVNHIEAHILVNFLENKKVNFPAISLVVSGGHTQLILVKKIGSYKIIGETRDDAAGECFDKCAKILGLEYPGGPAIAKIASQWKSKTINFKSQINLKIQNPKVIRGPTSDIRGRASDDSMMLPRPMIHTKDYDFSFSGLKTAVLYSVRDQQVSPVVRTTGLSQKFIQEMCVKIQQAIIDVLIKKTINAAKNYKVETIIFGGGVSANSELRSQFKSKTKNQIPKINIIFPEKNLSTDNALMIAITGYFNKDKKIAWQKSKANANLRIG